MKRSLKIIFLLIVAVILISIAAVAIHDTKLKNKTLRAFMDCEKAESDGHRELFYFSLYDACNSAEDFNKKGILLYNEYVSELACGFIGRITRSPFVKESTGMRRLHIYDYIYEISIIAELLNESRLSTITWIVSDYNTRLHSEPKDDEISKIQKVITSYPDDLVLYDVICRQYYRRHDYNSVLDYGVRSAGVAGDKKYRQDIVYMLYMSSCKLGRTDDAISYIGFAKEVLDFSILDYEMDKTVEL